MFNGMKWCIYSRLISMEMAKSTKENHLYFDTFRKVFEDLLFISGAFSIFEFQDEKRN